MKTREEFMDFVEDVSDMLPRPFYSMCINMDGVEFWFDPLNETELLRDRRWVATWGWGVREVDPVTIFFSSRFCEVFDDADPRLPSGHNTDFPTYDAAADFLVGLVERARAVLPASQWVLSTRYKCRTHRRHRRKETST